LFGWLEKRFIIIGVWQATGRPTASLIQSSETQQHTQTHIHRYIHADRDVHVPLAITTDTNRHSGMTAAFRLSCIVMKQPLNSGFISRDCVAKHGRFTNVTAAAAATASATDYHQRQQNKYSSEPLTATLNKLVFA